LIDWSINWNNTGQKSWESLPLSPPRSLSTLNSLLTEMLILISHYLGPIFHHCFEVGKTGQRAVLKIEKWLYTSKEFVTSWDFAKILKDFWPRLWLLIMKNWLSTCKGRVILIRVLSCFSSFLPLHIIICT